MLCNTAGSLEVSVVAEEKPHLLQLLCAVHATALLSMHLKCNTSGSLKVRVLLHKSLRPPAVGFA
jgi:hypothetical protein